MDRSDDLAGRSTQGSETSVPAQNEDPGSGVIGIPDASDRSVRIRRMVVRRKSQKKAVSSLLTIEDLYEATNTDSLEDFAFVVFQDHSTQSVRPSHGTRRVCGVVNTGLLWNNRQYGLVPGTSGTHHLIS